MVVKTDMGHLVERTVVDRIFWSKSPIVCPTSNSRSRPYLPVILKN